jgi:hypothetical protein
MSSISYSVVGKDAMDKHSSLFGIFVRDVEKKLIALTLVVNVINIFLHHICPDKALVCLSISNFLNLVQNLNERSEPSQILD